MIAIHDAVPPADFAPHFRKSPLTDPWEPLYSKRTAEAVVIGLYVRACHTNSRGFAHGGLITSLADNAMGLSCGQKLGGQKLEGRAGGLLTVNLSVDFVGAAKIGQWLQFDTHFVKAGSTLSFAQCFVTADGDICARASATFRAMPLKET